MASRALIILPVLCACRGSTKDADAPRAPETEPPFISVRDAGSALTRARRGAEGCPATDDRARWGAGTLHGDTARGSETWTRVGSPHRVPYGIHLLAGAQVTIEPCAVVAVGGGRDVVVQGDAALIAVGDVGAPVLFTSLAPQPNPGDWVGIEIRAHALPSTRFGQTTVEFAGASRGVPGEPAAAIRSWTRSGLSISNVRVTASAGYGVAMLDDAGFSSDAVGLTIEGSHGEGALYFADVDRVSSTPPGRYVGNARDEIVLAAAQRVVSNESTWRALAGGARYRVRRAARVIVNGAESPRLNLVPGTEVAFDEDAELVVGDELPGALRAVGEEPTKPVVLTSAARPAARASWVGVVLGVHTDLTRTALRAVTLAGAGAVATGVFDTCWPLPAGAVEPRGMLFLQGVSRDDLVSHVRFQAGPADGVAIVRTGAPALGFADFTRVSLCNDFALAGVRAPQTNPPGASGCVPSH